jgi:hypothetical protein
MRKRRWNPNLEVLVLTWMDVQVSPLTTAFLSSTPVVAFHQVHTPMFARFSSVASEALATTALVTMTAGRTNDGSDRAGIYAFWLTERTKVLAVKVVPKKWVKRYDGGATNAEVTLQFLLSDLLQVYEAQNSSVRAHALRVDVVMGFTTTFSPFIDGRRCSRVEQVCFARVQRQH